MYNLIAKLKNKKGLFVYGDPAGAKACLSICSILNNDLNLVLSNRIYSFSKSFNITVENNATKTIIEWFDYHNPDYLFTGTSIPDKNELFFILEAQLRNIKTFSFVDHWINIKERFKLNENYVYPSEICLINQKAKDIALNEGILPELLQITDNPYYTYLDNWRPTYSRIEILEQLNLDSDAEYIVYAPEPFTTFGLQKKFGFDELSGLQHIINALNQIKNKKIKIIVKAHPNQNHEIFREIINNDSIIYLKDFDLNSLLFYSKSVFGFFSNSLLEASKLNCKVYRILIDLKDPTLDSLSDQNIGDIIKSKQELLIELKKINNEKSIFNR